MRGLVIGLGSADRGDDGAGLEAANALARLVPEDVAVRSLPGREITLLDHWTDAPLVIVIDAVVSGAVPGTVHLVDVSAGRLRLGTPPGSSHAFGLAEVIELGRALGRLPERLIVLGIEAADCRAGAAVSGPVRAGLREAIRMALAEVGGS